MDKIIKFINQGLEKSKCDKNYVTELSIQSINNEFIMKLKYDSSYEKIDAIIIDDEYYFLHNLRENLSKTHNQGYIDNSFFYYHDEYLKVTRLSIFLDTDKEIEIYIDTIINNVWQETEEFTWKP